MNPLTPQPLGMMDRVKTLFTGQLPAELKEPEDKSRANLVKELNEWWTEHRKFWKPVFDRMQEDMAFASGQHWTKEFVSCEGNGYQADIIQRHIAQKESSLYAKNPTFEAKRRERREFSVWDGSMESLRGAQAILAQAQPIFVQVALQQENSKVATQTATDVINSGMATPEEAMQAEGIIAAAQQQEQQAANSIPPEIIGAQKIVEDYERGMMQKAHEEAFGETLRLLLDNQIDCQNPPFEMQCKQLVTRATTTGVGFAKIMFKRDLSGTPTESAVRTDRANRIEAIEAKRRMLSMPDAEPDSEAIEELRLMEQQLAEMEEPPQEVTDEGVIVDFLPSTSVIVDKNCRSLRGFVGCKRIAHEMLMEVADVEREFGVSLTGSGAAMYHGKDTRDEANKDSENQSEEDRKKARVCVAHIYDLNTQLCYVVCDGVKDFLAEPYSPKPDWDFFWPIVPLTFRPLEVEENKPDDGITCYPRSDVRLLRPMQEELNRAGEAFKQHRIANRPGWVALGSRWQGKDLEKLASPRAPFEVLRLEGINPGENIKDFLQPIPNQPIDPALYDNTKFQGDVLLVIGNQEANLGPVSGATATETSIAEGSRLQAANSNVDDFDKFLSLLAEGIGCLLTHPTEGMSEATVKKLVGPGAVWPQVSMEDFRENVWLEIQAGSSGPPNQALEIQVAEKIIPLLMLIPGISAELVARFAARALDPKIKIEDFFTPGMPSIQNQAQPQEQPGAPQGGLPPGTSAPQAGQQQQTPQKFQKMQEAPQA